MPPSPRRAQPSVVAFLQGALEVSPLVELTLASCEFGDRHVIDAGPLLESSQPGVKGQL